MPLRNETPVISISGRTASVSFCSSTGVRVHVSLPAPAARPDMDEDAIETALLADAAAALRSALNGLTDSAPK